MAAELNFPKKKVALIVINVLLISLAITYYRELLGIFAYTGFNSNIIVGLYMAVVIGLGVSSGILLKPVIEWYVYRGDKEDELTQIARLKQESFTKSLYSLIVAIVYIYADQYHKDSDTLYLIKFLFFSFFLINFFSRIFVYRYFITHPKSED